MRPTILHIEDDPMIANLVQVAFKRLGFPDEIVHVRDVGSALAHLHDLRARGERPRLILVDMHLPDGTGLDVIRRLKTDPAWAAVPLLVLTNEDDPATVNEAYALGASCYLSKLPKGKGVFESLEAVYRCWLENALLPTAETGDRFSSLLAHAVAYELRVSRLYSRFAEAFAGDPPVVQLWLELAMAEGNHANLLAYFTDSVHETDHPAETLDRLADQMQQVEDCLSKVEQEAAAWLSPVLEQALGWALRIEVCPSENLILEGLSILAPKGEVAASLLGQSMADHLERLVREVRAHTSDPDLLAMADQVQSRAKRLRQGSFIAPQSGPRS